MIEPRSLKRHPQGVADFEERLAGRRIRAAVRRGKFLWLPLDDGPDEAVLAHLGPDLTSPSLTDAEIDRAVERMTDAEIGVVLLDQRVASGIGNIWKNETLFVCGVDPFRSAADLDRDTKRVLVATASRLLQASVRGRGRPSNVYGRARRPCRRCGTPIRSKPQGEQARTAYWCPTCQT